MNDEQKNTLPESDFLDKTIEEWQPRILRKLNREDARQIAHNACEFFEALIELDKFDESSIHK